MYFYLKEPKSGKETSILIQYYVKSERKNFKYYTSEKILPSDWNFKDKIPKTKKGNLGMKLKKIKNSIMRYHLFLEKIVDNCKLNDTVVTRKYLKQEFDSNFKKTIVNNDFVYFVDFIDDFVLKAPSLINRHTREKYNAKKIRTFSNLSTILKDFQKYNKYKIRLDGFSLNVHDDFSSYLKEVRIFSENYIYHLVRDTKQLLKIAEKEFDYIVHKDYTSSNFSARQANVLSIALSEAEIAQLLTYDFSNNPKLENCRDFAIIGFWTGLRVGDLLGLPKINPDDDFITVQPNKTKKSSGVKIVIPLHHHIKQVLKERGMPQSISDTLFNLYIKEICQEVGLTTPTKGTLNVWIEQVNGYRKQVGVYPKYKLVSSHTCRRSFATNLYKMNFPTLSIMKITGHTTERSFLKYIKVTPKEHAEKLLEHWQNYYKIQKEQKQVS